MSRNRNILYLFVTIACAAGYVWLAIQARPEAKSFPITTCMLKHVTNIPCPACGSTRSVLSILDGEFVAALHWNPFGILVLAIMVICPLWISFDWIFKRDSFFRFYHSAQLFLRRKQVAIPAILLVLSNWIWNIYKGV
jgi:Protein of unknown function (DUF2752)